MPFTINSLWPAILDQIKAGATEGLAKIWRQDEIRDYRGTSQKQIRSHVWFPRASSPGDSPATDTGRLEDSIEVKAESELEMAIALTIAAYPLVLEFGGGRLAPRPLWLPVGMRLGGDGGQVAKIISEEIAKKVI